jgi:hypothetical protein
MNELSSCGMNRRRTLDFSTGIVLSAFQQGSALGYRYQPEDGRSVHMSHALLKALRDFDRNAPEFEWDDIQAPELERLPQEGEILVGDSRDVLKSFAESSVDLIVTDPPYFLDGLDNGWKKGGTDAPRATGTIGGLPVGMKFDPAQGRALQAFMMDVAGELFRVLKPGGFALIFSQPRLSH